MTPPEDPAARAARSRYLVLRRPIGGKSGIHLPPADLFTRVQRTRLVFMTGEKDELKLDEKELAACNARVRCELSEKLAGVAAAIDRGDRRQARALLDEIDTGYGGLAAPEVLALDARLR